MVSGLHRDLAMWSDSSQSPIRHFPPPINLEHQTVVHNQITLADYQTRLALRDQDVLDQMDGKPAAHRSPSIQHRIDSTVESLVQYL